MDCNNFERARDRHLFNIVKFASTSTLARPPYFSGRQSRKRTPVKPNINKVARTHLIFSSGNTGLHVANIREAAASCYQSREFTHRVVSHRVLRS